MELISTNRLRVSLRVFNKGYGERFGDWTFGRYKSSDHGKSRLETNYSVHALGIVAHLKWRPDGKRSVLNGS